MTYQGDDPDFDWMPGRLVRAHPELEVWWGNYQYAVEDENGRLRPVTPEEGEAIRRCVEQEQQADG